MDSLVLTRSPSVGSPLRWPVAQVKTAKRGLQLLVAITVLSLTAAASADYVVETLAVFEPPNVPEGIAVDQAGNIYMSMPLTGEIRKRVPDGTVSSLGMTATGPLGLAVDQSGAIHAALMSGFPPPTPPNTETHGIWKMSPHGAAQRLATLSVDTFPNDVAIGESGQMFVSDSTQGKIYRVSLQGDVEEWFADPLLLGDPATDAFVGPIGANGLALVGSDLFVNNTTRGSIIRIPLEPDGGSGTAEVALEDPLLWGADGLAADDRGNLYVANVLQDTILLITPNGAIETLADIDDGLSSPASLGFGPSQDNDLFFVNSSFAAVFFGGAPRPSLMKVVVPEPAGGVLLLLGLLSMAAQYRRTGVSPMNYSQG